MLACIQSHNMMAPLKIIVVEDYEPFRRVVCSLLLERGYSVVQARDGLEAIGTAKEIQPDVVLYDIDLPKLNGIE